MTVPLSLPLPPYLWYPVTGAAIERSFSLAGLVDVKIGRAWARTCVRPAPPCFAMVMLKNGSQNGSRPPPNVLCFVSSLVDVQVRQGQCIRNIFVPGKHHRKSRKYHGNTTENHRKSRKITENHGKSRKITEGFFHANHGNSRSPVCLLGHTIYRVTVLRPAALMQRPGCEPESLIATQRKPVAKKKLYG